MYDIHCHALSGIDDGAAYPEESLEMIRMAAKNGTKGIVLTPHCNLPGSYKNYKSERLLERFRTLRVSVVEAKIPVRIYAGLEIFCTDDVPALFEAGKLMTLNQSRYALIEFDFNEKTEFVLNIAEQIVAVGIVPIIAHPERYGFVREDPSNARRLKSLGCYLQVNKGSLEGISGIDVQQCAIRLLETRRADFIASDAHSPYVRNTVLAETYEYVSQYFSDEYAQQLLNINPCNVLFDKPLN